RREDLVGPLLQSIEGFGGVEAGGHLVAGGFERPLQGVKDWPFVVHDEEPLDLRPNRHPISRHECSGPLGPPFWHVSRGRASYFASPGQGGRSQEAVGSRRKAHVRHATAGGLELARAATAGGGPHRRPPLGAL